MSTKKLIVNADDWGQSRGINAGIIKAYEQGIVTSASLMVRYTSAKEAAFYSKNNPGLGVGLHVDLGEWVLKDGNWDSLYQVVSFDDMKEVEKEVRNQLESFYRFMDKNPTHIDSHQHVHQKVNLRGLFLEIAARLNLPLRGCCPSVKYCGDFYGQLEDGSPYHQGISVDGLKRIISNLPEGTTELACHPGLNNDLKTMYSKERMIEVDTLCNKSILESIRQENIELCSFDKIRI